MGIAIAGLMRFADFLILSSIAHSIGEASALLAPNQQGNLSRLVELKVTTWPASSLALV